MTINKPLLSKKNREQRGGGGEENNRLSVSVKGRSFGGCYERSSSLWAGKGCAAQDIQQWPRYPLRQEISVKNAMCAYFQTK